MAKEPDSPRRQDSTCVRSFPWVLRFSSRYQGYPWSLSYVSNQISCQAICIIEPCHTFTQCWTRSLQNYLEYWHPMVVLEVNDVCLLGCVFGFCSSYLPSAQSHQNESLPCQPDCTLVCLSNFNLAVAETPLYSADLGMKRLRRKGKKI